MTDTPIPVTSPPRADRTTFVIGLLVLLASLGVYLRTLTPTVPFWDAGEFIAVSTILGIPHPPGTPFYVLLGRIATMVPFASIAERVNGLSALASALTVLLTYLTTLRLVRIAQRRGIAAATAAPAAAGTPVPGPLETAARGPWAALRSEWTAHLGAVVAALMLAFSDNFWENATEAEVYALMSLAQVLVLWLGLRWWEAHEKRPTVGPLLLAVYVMWLSVGLHLGVGMMGLPLLVLLLLVDRKVAVLFVVPLLSVLTVAFGLERMAGWVLIFSAAVFWVYLFQRKLPLWVVLAATAGTIYSCFFAFGALPYTPAAALASAASVLVPLAVLARGHREGRILALALFLMGAGYSTHLYLPIRAAQHPAINEGNPSTWPALKALLEREQYGRTSMFVRRGTVPTQLDKEFWRYVKRQWPLVKSLAYRGVIPEQGEPRPWHVMLPLLLGLAGGAWQARRERVSFLAMLVLVLFSSAGMILFLNFSDREVRDRDYFFTTFYHAYAIWIGLGIAWLVAWIRDSFESGTLRAAATVAAAVLLAAQPFVVLRNLWYFHDRSANTVARDYAYNMLAPLAPDSYVFTNGDNDTFPLWYIQQVEGFRKDVKVVNLSLLNTDWYIFQLRDEEPKLPVRLPDEVIRALGAGAFQDSAGRIIYTNEFMVHHLLAESRVGDTAWVRRPYVAVTVPEHYGYDPYFTLEGLVYRVNRDTLGPRVDVPATARNLHRVFRYRGLFHEDGSWDASVYKDENASTLSRNYASAYVQLGLAYHEQGRLDAAIGELGYAARMFPDLAEVQLMLASFHRENGDTARATAIYRDLVRRLPDDPEAHNSYGVALMFQDDVAGALREFDAAIRLDPTYPRPYYSAYYLLARAGQDERALSYLQRLLDAVPSEEQARAILGASRPQGAPIPPPAIPFEP